MKKIFVAILILAMPFMASAQLISSQSIVIEQKTLEPVKPGFEQMVEGGCKLLGGDFKAYSYSLNLTYTAGYRFNNTFFLGAGTGLFVGPGCPYQDLYRCDGSWQIINDDRLAMCGVSVPLFIHARAYFTKSRISPFVGFSAGGFIGLAKCRVYNSTECWGSHYDDAGNYGSADCPYLNQSPKEFEYGSSNYFLEPSIGLNYRIDNTHSLYASLGIKIMGTPHLESCSDNGITTSTATFTQFGFNFGFTF